MRVFGERLKQLREARGLSQEELAEALQIGRTSISAYEQGKASPTGPVVAKIARFFDVSADYLLGLTDDPSPKGDGLSPVIRQKLKEYEELKKKFERLKEFLKEFVNEK